MIGEWKPNPRGVLELVRTDGVPRPKVVDFRDLIACPTCRARATEPCRTRAGRDLGSVHASRLISRRCPCGETLEPRHIYCRACADRAQQIAKRDCARRRREVQRVAS